MEDLLKLNELVSATKTEIFPPRLNKTIKAHNPLVLMGTSMNVIEMTMLSLEDCMCALAMAHTIVVV